MSKIYKPAGKKDLFVKITSKQLVNGIDIYDYAGVPAKMFVGNKILPDKGAVSLSHYTGTSLFIEEYSDYKVLNADTTTPRLVRNNVNAVIGDIITDKDEATGKIVQLSKHRPKGRMSLLNYNNSGLEVKEKQVQYRGGAHLVSLQLQDNVPLGGEAELSNAQLLLAQFSLEDITQDERDVDRKSVV